jgi:hypothetical protein
VILATSAGHFKCWRYGKSREFWVKLNFAPKNSRTFYPELSHFTVSSQRRNKPISRQVGLFYSLNLRWMHNRYPNVNKEKWLTFSLILCQKPGMDGNYCLIVFIVYMSYKHTSIFIYSSWQLSMEHFPLAICDFQTTFLKTEIKATEVSILATSAGHLKYWRYGKTREFRVKSSGIFWEKVSHSSLFTLGYLLCIHPKFSE